MIHMKHIAQTKLLVSKGFLSFDVHFCTHFFPLPEVKLAECSSTFLTLAAYSCVSDLSTTVCLNQTQLYVCLSVCLLFDRVFVFETVFCIARTSASILVSPDAQTDRWLCPLFTETDVNIHSSDFCCQPFSDVFVMFLVV